MEWYDFCYIYYTHTIYLALILGINMLDFMVTDFTQVLSHLVFVTNSNSLHKK